MSYSVHRFLRLILVVSLLVGALALLGCSENDPGDPGPPATMAPSEQPASQEQSPSQDQAASPEQPASSEQSASPEQPSTTLAAPDSYVVYINDDDSYTEGGITYSIALNLTATNPTQDRAGTYTGSATAKTDTTGDIGGQPLNASAMVNSSQLSFVLDEGFDTGGDALFPLTEDELIYTGSGTIVMSAAGSGSVGAAGGTFSNTSGQPIKVDTKGSAVTLKVVINGHEYTFEGTISGQ